MVLDESPSGNRKRHAAPNRRWTGKALIKENEMPNKPVEIGCH